MNEEISRDLHSWTNNPLTNISVTTDEDRKHISDCFIGIKVKPEEAGAFLGKIENHKNILEKDLGRDIGDLVAALDYMHNIENILKDPKIVESNYFNKIISNSREDVKTGCYNEKYFKEAFYAEIRRAARHSQNVSLLLLDIDDFKKINDSLGHYTADKVLKDFVSVLTKNLRTEDILARFGGDEFILLLPQIDELGAVMAGKRLKSKILKEFENITYDGEKIQLSFSGGISVYPRDGENYKDMLKCADQALYMAKNMGKNHIIPYNTESGSFNERQLKNLAQ